MPKFRRTGRVVPISRRERARVRRAFAVSPPRRQPGQWKAQAAIWGVGLLGGIVAGSALIDWPYRFNTGGATDVRYPPELASQATIERQAAAPYTRNSPVMSRRPAEREVASIRRRASTEWASATASFGMCKWGGGTNCVVDGDTLYLGGTKIRVADIDAPETHDYRCPEELALGERAATRLEQLVNSGPVTLAPIGRDEDRYGRKLRVVLVGGVSVGDTLVSEGLARPYAGGRRSWCG